MSTNLNRFIVTSHGWSGSNWLAYALNLNENILCTHSARNIIANDVHMHSNKNLKKNIQDFHKGYVSRQAQSITDTYSAIMERANAPFYGSVHVLRLRDLPVVVEKFGPPACSYNVMNLIRNPISLVWSGYGQFKDLFRFDINELHWTLGKILTESKDFIYAIGEKYNINIGEIDNLAFIGAACVLGSLRKDEDAREKVLNIEEFNYLGNIKMEDITSDKDYFRAVVKTLTNSGFSVSDEYLDQVFSLGKVNVHKQDKKKLSAEEKYKTLEDWQKEVLSFYLDKYNIIKEYSKHGYHFEYLKKSYA